MCSCDLEYNYYALVISILRQWTPEQSFYYLENNEPGKPEITKEDVKEMARLKEAMTYQEIGDIYGISDGAVYTRIRRLAGRI